MAWPISHSSLAGTLKFKTENFDVKTRVTQLPTHTSDGDVIGKAALRLLSAKLGQQPLRLLGVRMSQLSTAKGRSSSSGKQRTLSELLQAAECPAAKKRKLDVEATLMFTCPVCHSWRTPDGDLALSRHIDDCLNQQVIGSSSGRQQSNLEDRFVIRKRDK